jgi:replicative DNA helicase
MSSKLRPEVQRLIFSPSEAASAHIDWARTQAETDGSTWGIPEIDRLVIPDRPGELIVYMGRPSDGKSSLLAYRALREANLIANDPSREGEVVVFVTFDDSAEEIENFFIQGYKGISSTDVAWGKVDIDLLKERAVRRASLPIWIIGHSISRSALFSGSPPIRMTPDVVFDAIECLQQEYDSVNKVAMVMVDYAQRIPVPGSSNRVEEVTEAIHRMKELAVRVGTSVHAAVQASRAVEQLDIKLAEMGHCQHSSAIEQDANKVFACWRPWRSELGGVDHGRIVEGRNGLRVVRGGYVEIPGSNGMDDRHLLLSESLFLLHMVKQKGASGRAMWPLFFHPAYLRLAAREEELAT